MALAMSRPFKHPKTGIFWFRKRVPEELRQHVGKREELRSLKTRDPLEAKRLFAQVLVEVEAKWANLRRGPLSLSEREAHEIAAVVHDEWLAKYRDNPAEQTFWRTDLTPRLWADVAILDYDNPGMSIVAATMKEMWCTEQAQHLLSQRGMQVDASSERKLAKAVAAAMQRASLTLAQFAEGRYEADHLWGNPAGLKPNRPPQEAQAPAPVKIDNLFDRWVAEKRPAEKTVYEWRRVTKRLTSFLNFDDASRVTAEDLLRWKAEMIDSGLRPKTIRDAHLAPIRALFRWAADNRLISSNPAERVTIDVKVKPGEAIRSFTDEEATVILKAALGSRDPVKRWVPWLCAYSGARVSEVCQLRREDVVSREGFWSIKFDPEAGSLKTLSSERIVPLHPAVLDRGFLEFARSEAHGPLFSSLPPDKFGKRGGNGTKVLGRWVRSLGVVDLSAVRAHETD